LDEPKERFNELCVIKELTIPYHDEAMIAKSKALFHREASTLYQIDHPQIPRFWAAFEDENRFFLVQSYIEGQTYRQLLSDRLKHGRTFSETEVLHLLNQLLPVLSYIHSLKVVHRDITPENIIRHIAQTKATPTTQLQSEIPVLIDFGAVKEATNHWFLASMTTRVGKVGYAPPEQLQTGMVTPSSDLYSLGATCLVLLTGQEPRKLIDGETLNWRWDACRGVRDEVIMLLNRMLAVYPGDRYPAADAVLADLQPLLETVHRPVRPVIAKPSLISSKRATPREADQRVSQPKSRNEPPSKQPYSGRRSSPWRLGAIAASLAIVGAAIPVVWRLLSPVPDSGDAVWISGQRVPRSEISRIIDSQTPQSRAALKSRTGSAVALPAQVLEIPAERVSTNVQGNLAEGQSQPYLLRINQGQIATVTLEGEQVSMNLLRSNQQPVDNAATQTQNWTGQIPATDDYTIQVNGKGQYVLEVTVTPFNRPSQEQTQRIQLTQGRNGTTVTGQLSAAQIQRYLVRAKRGQLMRVKLLEGKAQIIAIAPSGQPINQEKPNLSEWQGALPQDGDYVIELTAEQPQSYALLVEVY